MFQKRFFFLGERLAVDFLNTVVEQGGRVDDLLERPGAVAAWARAARVLRGGDLQFGGLARPHAVRALRNFREELRRGLVAWAATSAFSPRLLSLLNRSLAEDPEIVTLIVRHGAVITRREHGGDPLARLYGALARSAAEMLQHDTPGRLRKCAWCRLMFYDVSKAGRRRWCSMQLCGARAKARAFRQRVRNASKDQEPPPTSNKTSATPSASS